MSISVPVQSKERLFILDAIRGVALCGILILNIYYFARPEQAIFNLDVYHEAGIGNVAWWYLTNFLVEGSFRALFSMLFGAGCILLVSRLQKQDNGLAPADIYYSRIIWLVIFGIVDAFVFLWPGDILYSYAVCGLFIFPFRKSSVRLLLFMVVFFMCITMFKSYWRQSDRLSMREKGLAAIALEDQKKTLSAEQKADKEKWNGYLEKANPENKFKESEKEIAAMQQSYPEVWTHLLTINKKMESSIFYNELFFDVLIFVFLGMALYKLGLLTGERPGWVYGIMIVAGYTLGLGRGLVTGHDWRIAHYDYFEYLKIRHFYFDLYQFQRVCVSFGHIGVLVLLWKSGWFQWLLKPFASVGQMAFTNYLMQSIMGTLIFYGYGFGYFGKLQRYELAYVVVAVWIFQLIFSGIWLRYFLFGPMEWLWRSLTYWKRQPMLRVNESAGQI